VNVRLDAFSRKKRRKKSKGKSKSLFMLLIFILVFCAQAFCNVESLLCDYKRALLTTKLVSENSSSKKIVIIMHYVTNLCSRDQPNIA